MNIHIKSINNLISDISVIAFPATVLLPINIYGVAAVLLILLGVWQVLQNPRQSLAFSGTELLFFFSMLFIVFSVLLTSFVKHADIARADRFFIVVLAIPMYIYLKRYPPSEGSIWLGVIMGAICASIIALYQVEEAPHLSRAGGDINPIMFGDISLALGVMAAASLGYYWKKGKWLVIFPIVGMFSGLIGSVLSLSRGGWLALPVIAIFAIWYLNKWLSYKLLLLGFVIGALVISAIYLSPQTGVEGRIDSAINDTNSYINSQNVTDAVRGKSVGVRFEMWKAAWLIFKENKFLGVGWGNYKYEVNRLIEKGITNKAAGHYYHAHNQYLSALAKGGGIGLLAIISLLLYPYLVLKRKITLSHQKMVGRLALAGCLLIICFSIFGLTESIMERARALNCYIFLMVVFVSINLNHDDTLEYNNKLTFTQH